MSPVRLLNLLFHLLLFAALLVGALLYSPQALRLALEIARPALPEGLSIGRIEGPLVGPLTLQNVTWHQAGMQLQLQRAQLQWQASALLHQQVNITQLQFSGITIQLTEASADDSSDTAASPSSFSLPLPIRVAQLQARDITLKPGAGRAPIHLSELTARGHAAGSAIHIPMLQAHNPTLQLSASGSWLGDHLRLDTLQAHAGASHLQAQGRIGKQLQASWQVSSPDLGQLLPGASGHLHSRGSVSGSMYHPSINATLQADGLRYGRLHAGKLRLQSQLQLDRDSASHLQLSARHLQLGALQLSKLSATAEGTASEHVIHLQAAGQLGSAVLTLRGSWPIGSHQWSGQLLQAQLDPAHLPRWQLLQGDEPPTLQLSAQAVALQRSCLVADQSRACIEGSWNPQNTHGSLQLQQFPLALLQPWLPSGTQLHGQVDATATATSAAHPISPVAAGNNTATVAVTTSPQPPIYHLTLQASGKQLQLRQQMQEEEGALATTLQSLQFTAQGNVSTQLQQWQLQAAMQTLQGDSLKLTAKADNLLLPQAPIQATLSPQIQHFDMLRHFLPNLQRLEGQLQGTVQLSGSLQQPQLGGALTLDSQQLVWSQPELRLDNLQLRIEGAGQAVSLQARSHDARGTLALQGQLLLPQFTAKATLTGTHYKVMDTPDARIWINPNLQLRYADQHIQISGQVQVPQADITPHSLNPNGVIRTSPDQVIVTEKQPAQAAADIPLTAQVKIIMGDAVQFQGAGLSARITGALTLHNAPGKLTTATGELQLVNGAYRIYGQKLDITQGQLVYNGGPITEPGLNFEAQRQPTADVTVGVRVRGLASNPDITLYSQPDMSQAEILSWLIFGTPLDSGGGHNAVLYRAALALGLNQGQTSARRLGKQLGLDTLTIDSSGSNDFSDAALVIGKYLSSRLYVSYGIGLFDAVRTLHVRYQLSRRWSLEVTSGQYRGGDILYSIER